MPTLYPGDLATLTPPMPEKVQAAGPVMDNGKGVFPGTDVRSINVSRAANGGLPGRRPLLGPSPIPPIEHA